MLLSSGIRILENGIGGYINSRRDDHRNQMQSHLRKKLLQSKFWYDRKWGTVIREGIAMIVRRERDILWNCQVVVVARFGYCNHVSD
jgi:hypothetical protein